MLTESTLDATPAQMVELAMVESKVPFHENPSSSKQTLVLICIQHYLVIS